MTLTAHGSSALDALYWRAEILQAMYWMRGEGIANAVSAAQLADFLVVSREDVGAQLTALVDDGYLSCDGGSFALTPLGVTEGGHSFQDEFGDITRPAHYECGPGCWCQEPDHIGEPCPSRPAPEPRPAPDPDEPAEHD
jgi:hypothetical protein